MQLRSLAVLLVVILAGCGGSQVDVNVDNDGRDRHEKIFDKEMGPRSGDDQKAAAFFLQPAAYTPETLALDVSGIVMVKMLIAPDGSVVKSEIIQSVHPDVDRAAEEAALRSKYRPARRTDVAVEGWLTVPYRFPPTTD